MTSLALLFDTGCFILIWLVQLVIYPSFGFYQPTDLIKWHSKYTRLVTIVVLPLMTGQLALGILQALSLNYLNLLKIILIAITWAVTFLIFVPLHNQINGSKEVKPICEALVSKNWIRTILWSLIFLLSVFQHFTP